MHLTNHADSITWHFMANGEYFTRSTYAIVNYEWEGIWKAKAKNK
jgi:hypothetical protein